jgi:hypothetical protein
MNAEGEVARSKLVIDEDWKTRVEAEKAEMEKRRGSAGQAGQAEESGEAGDSAAPAGPQTQAAQVEAAQVEAAQVEAAQVEADPTGSSSPREPQLPPASIGSLIMMLATQAMLELGQIPDPLQQKRTVRKSAARHYIDTLEVLEEKTKGNLTAEESRYLAAILNELRMAYVQQKG